MDLKNLSCMVGVAVLACAVFLRSPGSLAGVPAGEVPVLSPAEARELIVHRAGDRGFVLLDVRTPQEFKEERIEGAVMIDYRSPTFRDEVAKLDRGKAYLVYCRSGSRSREAIKVMQEQGFRDVRHLDGGILRWKEAGLPTAR